MKRLPDNQCRRCGLLHEEVWQLVDSQNRWAVAMAECGCGHRWSMVYTAPVNLGMLRAWLSRGCQPVDGPLAPASGAPWHEYRLEGICPLSVSPAS